MFLRSFLTTLLSAALLLLSVAGVANVSLAQGPGGPGGGFFGGPGGPGGMAGAGAMLLAIPEVQTELKLTDDQKEKIKTEGESIRDKAREAFSGIDFAALRDMTDDERTKAMADVRKKMEGVGKEVEEKMKTILDSKQQERLKQLQLQREGGSALLRPEVIEKLKLTTEQQDKLKKLQEAARPTGGMRALFNPDMTDEERKAAREKMQTSRDKGQKEMLAVLTDDQSMDWTEMCGKTFKFPPMQFGRRGGGGGPGGPGAGPGGPAPGQ